MFHLYTPNAHLCIWICEHFGRVSLLCYLIGETICIKNLYLNPLLYVIINWWEDPNTSIIYKIYICTYILLPIIKSFFLYLYFSRVTGLKNCCFINRSCVDIIYVYVDIYYLQKIKVKI